MFEAAHPDEPAPHYPMGSDSWFYSSWHLQWQFFVFLLRHKSCEISVHDQGSNLGHGKETLESSPLDHQGAPYSDSLCCHRDG